MPGEPRRHNKIHPLRDALLAGICTFVVSAVGLAILYLRARDAQVDAVRTELLQLARATAAQIDGDLLGTLVSPEQQGSPEHLRLLEPLARMHRATQDIYYVYTGVYRDGRIYWVLDGANLYRVPGNDLAPAPIMSLYEDRDAAYEAAFRDGREYTDPEPRANADGHSYLSAAAPIRDSHGRLVGMFGLDMVLDKFEGRIASMRRVLYTALAVVTLLSIGAGAVAHQLRGFTAAVVAKMRRARAEAEQNAAAAEAANRAKASFLAMMSHEIRTPMNGMLGVADLLRARSTDPEQRKLLDVLAGSGESLLRIINDILDFSKIEAEKLELRPQVFELARLLAEVDALLGTQARARDLRFVIDASPDLPVVVQGDRQRLSQVLLNLGNNAVKFTDRGEVRLVVRSVEDAAGARRIEFSMRDTGIGISPESMSRLFTPFGQVSEGRTHRVGGTGLGLVISQKLVRLMGGEISVESAPRQGSTFRFALDLPLAERGADPVRPAVAAPRTGAALCCLVAEDNAVNQMIVKAMLKQLGHIVTVVGNGREALAALAAGQFDLVLMDCNMPELDGLEATRQLRAGTAGSRAAGVTVIALTANAMDGDREACLAAGMDDFLSKPVSLNALREALDRAAADEGDGGEPGLPHAPEMRLRRPA
ncbi:MAG TPA: ATP-binding protein [Steroidobacteraceae bacterium]|nr:ATP-binding protein [Steroidobacteraceae bacterium]